MPEKKDNKGLLGAIERFAERSLAGDFNFAPELSALSGDERRAAQLLSEVIGRREAAFDRELEKYLLASRALGIAHWEMGVADPANPLSPENHLFWSPETRRLMEIPDGRQFAPRLSEWIARVHPDDLDMVSLAMEAHLSDRTGLMPYSVQYRMMTFAGEYRTFRATGGTVRDQDGTPLRMAGSLEDATERLRQQEMLKSILNGMDALITVCDPYDFRVLFLNNAIRNHFGIKSSGVGEFCYEILQHQTAPCAGCPYNELVKDPGKTIIWDHHESVTNLILHKTARLIDWPGGGKAHLEYAIDITALVNTEEALERRERMLGVLNKAAALLLSTRAETFEDSMTAGIGLIAGIARIDRVSISRNTQRPDGLYATQIYRWYKAQGVLTPREDLRDNPYKKDIPRWGELLQQGQNVSGIVSHMPEAEALAQFGCLAVLAVPVFNDRRFWGFVLFENLTEEREYGEAEVDILRSAGYMLTNAVIRNEEAEKLRAADEHLKLMLNSTPLSTVMWNEEREIVDCNDTAVSIHGLTDKAECIARFYEGFSPTRDGDEGYHYIRHLLDKAFVYGHCETNSIIYALDGAIVEVAVIFTRLRNGDDYVVVGYARDMREHNRMMREIDRQNTLLATVNRVSTIMLSSTYDLFYTDLLHSMAIMAETVEVEHVYLWKNERGADGPVFLQIYEWPDPAAEPPAPTAIPFPDGWRKTLSGNKSVVGAVKDFPLEEQLFLMNRSTASVIVIPIFLSGKFWGGVGFEDLWGERVFTEREEAILRATSELIAEALVRHEMEEGLQISAAKLQQALVEAQAASIAKSEFLSSMSHEMRTPLNAVIGMTAIGRRSADAERKNYSLDRIEEASTYLLGVINDILDMSKIEAGKLELSPVEFNFEQMLQKVVTVISYRVNEKKQLFTVNLDPQVPRFLVGDDQRLAQVIANLLSNAVKFTPERGEISVDVTLENERDGLSGLRVEVRDNGIGISPEHQAKLFQSFGQAESGIAREFGGTGLGLAISRQLIEMMGGKIWVESEQGKGSCFIFEVDLPGGVRNPRSMLEPDINWENVSVLTVDDSGLVRKQLRDSFDRLGVTCETAADAATARHIIERHGAFDVYLIDWIMPKENGVELIRWIKSQGITGAAVLISSASWELMHEAVRDSGADRVLAKPIFSSSLVDCMNECLAGAVEGLSTYAEGEFTDKTILLAEDIEINREIVLSLLEETGVRIDCAGDGIEALSMMERDAERYDLVLMDMQMPLMDGLEATRRIRAAGNEKCKTIPIVAMTANVFKDDIESCLAAGMNDHIGKPINLEELIAKLRQYLMNGSRVGLPRSKVLPVQRLASARFQRANVPPALREGLGVSIDIRVTDGRGKKTLSLPSVVEEVYPDQSFLIRAPRLDGGYFPIPGREMCLLYFTAGEGHGGEAEMYAVPVRQIETTLRDGKQYAKLEPLGKVERSQRRGSCRLSLSISVSLWRSASVDAPPFFANLINFCDGGMLLALDEDLGLGERIALEFEIGEQEAVEGVVVRKESTPENRHLYRIAIQFSSADKAQKERFRQYVLEHMK